MTPGAMFPNMADVADSILGTLPSQKCVKGNPERGGLHAFQTTPGEPKRHSLLLDRPSEAETDWLEFPKFN